MTQETPGSQPTLEFPWPWPRPSADDDKDDKTPLLLLPGICGTILNVRKKGDKGDGKRAWVCIEYADYVYRQLWGRYNAETGLVDSLQDDLEVIVPQSKKDDGGLFPIDVLDPDIYLPLHVIYYYRAFITRFEHLGYKRGTSLFGFGYDFRQSNRVHVEALLAKLQDIYERTGKRVDVVTHSMGGLVLRSLLAQHPDLYQKYVRKWVAIAVPFGGAPGFCMDALLTGVQFAWGWQEYFFVARSTMHQMAAQAPSVHELLPCPHFNWPRSPPMTTVWLAGGSDEGAPPVKEEYSISQYRHLMQKALSSNKVVVDGKELPLPMNDACWQCADYSRNLWAKVELPEGCQFYNIFGTGLPTPYDVIFGSPGAPLASHADISSSLADYTVVDGDCTVPVECANADNLPAVERAGVIGSHRGLLELPIVWDIIHRWVTDEPPPTPGPPAPLPNFSPGYVDPTPLAQPVPEVPTPAVASAVTTTTIFSARLTTTTTTTSPSPSLSARHPAAPADNEPTPQPAVQPVMSSQAAAASGACATAAPPAASSPGTPPAARQRGSGGRGPGRAAVDGWCDVGPGCEVALNPLHPLRGGQGGGKAAGAAGMAAWSVQVTVDTRSRVSGSRGARGAMKPQGAAGVLGLLGYVRSWKWRGVGGQDGGLCGGQGGGVEMEEVGDTGSPGAKDCCGGWVVVKWENGAAGKAGRGR